MRLQAELWRRGIDPTYYAADHSIAVISVTADLTVWYSHGRYTWREAGHPVTWPAYDPQGAAQRLAQLIRPMAGRFDPGRQGRTPEL